MPYIHKGSPVTLHGDPIDPDSSDWFYWILGGITDGSTEVAAPFLASGEAVQGTPTALAVNGTIDDGPTLYATRTGLKDGYTYTTVYGVKATPTATSGTMELTLRFTTTADRTNLDKTIRIPIRET